jgi:hypothetical protein
MMHSATVQLAHATRRLTDPPCVLGRPPNRHVTTGPTCTIDAARGRPLASSQGQTPPAAPAQRPLRTSPALKSPYGD